LGWTAAAARLGSPRPSHCEELVRERCHNADHL
jgi:hypothetical protein